MNAKVVEREVPPADVALGTEWTDKPTVDGLYWCKSPALGAALTVCEAVICGGVTHLYFIGTGPGFRWDTPVLDGHRYARLDPGRELPAPRRRAAHSRPGEGLKEQ